MSQRNFILDKQGTIPTNMVHVPGINLNLRISEHPEIDTLEIADFLIDRFEVTNSEFKAFIDSGAYEKRDYWKFPFIKEGKEISWEKAMQLFLDKSGRHGPSAWEGSDFPKGQDFFPVCGVSWYEAAAYAEYAGKSLPTRYHWARAAGFAAYTICAEFA
jgi:formylglycine-generating enzyme required for sulfatase activity